MENPPPTPNEPKQICSITIAFPVTSDDDAIAVKKKIDEATADLNGVRIDFRIMNMGQHGPPI